MSILYTITTINASLQRGVVININSAEIAKMAGVSRSTVSRVINGYSNVPPETREKVEAAIKKYGYTPNNLARSLAGKPASTVGLFFVEYGTVEENIIHSSPFYSEFLVNAIDKLKKHGYQLLVSIVNSPEDFDAILAQAATRSISACIMMGDIVTNDTLERISQSGCPVCLINQRSSVSVDGVYLLNTENYQSAYDAVQLLVNAGHKHIAHITGSIEKASVRERFEGYRDCLLHNGRQFSEDYVCYTHIHRAESGYQAVKELMSRGLEAPTAIFAANDLLAVGAIRALKESGYRVPEDISVVGFDNAELSRYTSPPLTTVSTNTEKLTSMAIENILSVVEKRGDVPAVQKMPEYELIMRRSIAEAPAEKG